VNRSSIATGVELNNNYKCVKRLKEDFLLLHNLICSGLKESHTHANTDTDQLQSGGCQVRNEIRRRVLSEVIFEIGRGNRCAVAS
jgi:hypothetical protein